MGVYFFGAMGECKVQDYIPDQSGHIFHQIPQFASIFAELSHF